MRQAAPCGAPGAVRVGVQGRGPAGARVSALVAACVAASLAFASIAHAAPYATDPTHTFVYFELPAAGGLLSTQRGRFDRAQGEGEFDRLGRNASFEVRVETASISTGIAALDARLCAPEALDCAAHPQAVFRATQFGFGDSGLPTQAAGSLTLRGTTLPLTLTARRFNCYPNLLLLREVCGGDFEATLEPAAFGIASGGATGVPERIPLVIQVEAIRQ